MSQNVDNFLGDRPSTRVRAPPGGASSICFGSSEPTPAPVRRVPATSQAAAPAAKREEPAPKAAEPTPKAVLRDTNNVVAAPAPTRKGVSSNAYATGSNQNCGNVITDRPTTRLHAPPGGKSSFSLGWN